MKHNYYLPSIENGEAVQGQGEMNGCATAFAEEWLKQLGDKGKQMRSDSRLVAAAQKQAEWLQVHDFVPGHPHWGEGDSTANERVRAEEYRLPDWWPAKGNEVESAARSWDVDMADVVRGLMEHATHYDHMHVINWFADHTVYGVGCAGTYFVVVTAPIEQE